MEGPKPSEREGMEAELANESEGEEEQKMEGPKPSERERIDGGRAS